ncbi:hypothetical protein E2C01_009457 [Portunus trituberculatus]|uniref:Uncharacterized protein n=1 Tax=Portunus trituberculatus TaxID=210409 RepID=A0A5B7D5U6_PORTR|nr:hypothetical protein [Portunus trituberculatus]
MRERDTPAASLRHKAQLAAPREPSTSAATLRGQHLAAPQRAENVLGYALPFMFMLLLALFLGLLGCPPARPALVGTRGPAIAGGQMPLLAGAGVARTRGCRSPLVMIVLCGEGSDLLLAAAGQEVQHQPAVEGPPQAAGVAPHRHPGSGHPESGAFRPTSMTQGRPPAGAATGNHQPPEDHHMLRARSGQAASGQESAVAAGKRGGVV